MNSKRWAILLLSVLIGILIIFGGITVVVDPYFHFHAPLSTMQYPIDNQRYQNDGIVRHFDYDAVITGSSMTENFKTSEMDAIYGTHSVKVPFSGGSFKEVNELLERAFRSNNDIKMVVRGLDYMRLLNDKDDVDYGDLYPSYLYDDNPFNDVSYIYNKSIFIDGTYKAMAFTRTGKTTTSFDEYCNWSDYYAYGFDAIIDSTYKRENVEVADTQRHLSEEDREMIRGNVSQNITDLVAANPDTDFYLFFTPYSILCWDYFTLEGRRDITLEAEQYFIELLLEYDNIHLYSFSDDLELTSNLDNYHDVAHYGGWINSQILEWMHEGKGQLTKDNYLDYCSRVKQIYTEYDYDSLFD